MNTYGVLIVFLTIIKEPTETGSYSFKNLGYTGNGQFEGSPKVPWINFSANEEITVTNKG